MFTDTLKAKVLADNDKSYHQRILNACYADWQDERNNWGYAEMLENANEKYGELAKFATLVGKYNQQVCNGGHIQYWDNGYASAGSDGCGSHHKDTELHEELLNLLSKYGLRTSTKHGEFVYNLMQKFLNGAQESGSCYECEGQGVFYETDDEGEEYEDECCVCGGDGVDENGIGDVEHLDSPYYTVYEEWEVELEAFFVAQLAK